MEKTQVKHFIGVAVTVIVALAIFEYGIKPMVNKSKIAAPATA